ncbi:flavin reductase family protein [Chloroflexota bacterium]
MSKVTMGPTTLIYPMPALLIGADVDGKPNFLTVAWAGIADGEPPMISIAIRHIRYTIKGILQNNAFSVNVPSIDLVKETDYCGCVSGDKVDKVDECQFKIFYGKLGGAPLIEQCPVNMECKVVHILDLGSHALVVGRIEETHISEGCLSNGKPAVEKINPLVYAGDPERRYQAMGDVVGKAFSVGLELKKKE